MKEFEKLLFKLDKKPPLCVASYTDADVGRNCD